MLYLADALQQQFKFESIIKQVTNVPNVQWKQAIPEKFKNYSTSQIKNLFKSVSIPKNVAIPQRTSNHDMKESINWPALYPECFVVRDSENCHSSGWAFATIGAFSDTQCIQQQGLKPRVQYSEQYLLSCHDYNLGCEGGDVVTAFQYSFNIGLVTDSCLPFSSGESGVAGVCPTKCIDGTDLVPKHKARYMYWPSYSPCVEFINEWLQNMTVGVMMGVYEDFLTYESGIYHHVVGSKIGEHAVQIVGYGEENGNLYWLVKNSFGSDWGESGYFRILRNVNECGIETVGMAVEF